MPDDSGDEEPNHVVIHQRQHREARVFSGKSGEDVDDWLKHYERVSTYNRWDGTIRLANVVFFLSDTALLWFENHEESLTSWDTFVTELKQCFGDSATKKKRAEQILQQRAQLPGETCTRYIEDVLKLCKEVNASMSEEDKVGHLLKGIAEDVYRFLIAKESLTTAALFIQHCRTFEALKTRRITPKFGRLTNVTDVASVDNGDSLPAIIRRIVREELARATPSASDRSFVDACALQDTRQPAGHYVHTMPTQQTAELPETRDRQRYSDQPNPYYRRTEFFRRQSPTQRSNHPGQRTVGSWYENQQVLPDPRRNRFVSQRERTVCFRCGIVGHIARYCRRRFPRYTGDSGLSDTDDWAFDREEYETPRPRDFASRNRNQRDNQTVRNLSPASDRSLTPPNARTPRSPSPRRRRSSSPPLGN